MNIFNKILLVMSLVLGLTGFTMAATTPNLGDASSFGILSSTFTYNGGVTPIGGDLAFTSPGGGGTYSVVGSVFTPAPPQAWLDQNSARAFLDAQVCDFTFAPGPIDLASDTTHGPIGVYTSGVYCVIGAMSISSTPGIILSGGGTFIFRASGAFSTAPNMIVDLTGGTSSCNVFWTFGAATTLGANNVFLGTVINDSSVSMTVTVGNATSWIGRILAFAQTVTVDTSSITVPVCTVPATLHVIKQVINDNGGTALASSFALSVKRFNLNIIGSPASGTVTPGLVYSISAGAYVVSESINTSYAQSFSWDCSSTWYIKLLAGEEKTCIIINNDIALPTGGGGGTTLSMDNCPDGDYSVSYYDRICGIVSTGIVAPIVTGDVEIIPVVSPVIVPTFPKTGSMSENTSSLWNIALVLGAIVIASSVFSLLFKKRKI